VAPPRVLSVNRTEHLDGLGTSPGVPRPGP